MKAVISRMMLRPSAAVTSAPSPKPTRFMTRLSGRDTGPDWMSVYAVKQPRMARYLDRAWGAVIKADHNEQEAAGLEV
jgi:hypothetical protein